MFPYVSLIKVLLNQMEISLSNGNVLKQSTDTKLILISKGSTLSLIA